MFSGCFVLASYSTGLCLSGGGFFYVLREAGTANGGLRFAVLFPALAIAFRCCAEACFAVYPSLLPPHHASGQDH